MEKDFNLLPGIIDSHFHSLQMLENGIPVHSVLSECFENGLALALDIGVSVDDFERRYALCTGFSRIYFTVGISPSELKGIEGNTAERRIDSMMQDLEQMTVNQKIIGIGEIGLDYHWMDGPRELQQELFIRQLQVAAHRNLPVVTHSRDADADMVKILERETPPRKGIMHCFSSTPETAVRLADMGFYISFAGNLTYPKNHDIHESARQLAANRILVETDAPYLSPVPVRGKPNSPGYIGYTLRFLAALRNSPPEELVETTSSNFMSLFNLRTDHGKLNTEPDAHQ